MRIPDGFPIIVRDAMPAPVLYAARQGQDYLNRMTGGDHPIASQAEGFALRFSQGAALPDGAFRIRMDHDGLHIIYGEPCGAVYGIYALLEKCGCGFLAVDCETVPKGPLDLPEGEWEEHPAFPVRELFWREAMDGAFAVKLRLNSARSSITPEQGGKAPFYNFSHTFNWLVPVDEYFDTHPEYFSMINGKRLRERTQLCLTNPEVLQLCVEGVKEFVLETVKLAGANPCPPMVLGIGIGGDFERVAEMAKEALMLPLDQHHADPYYAELENELLALVNATGIGPQGLGGKTTCLGLHILAGATHIAGLPVAVNVSCHVTRHQTAVL